jgi:hypothetical protein
LLNQLFMVEAEEVEIDNRSMKQTTTPLNWPWNLLNWIKFALWRRLDVWDVWFHYKLVEEAQEIADGEND